MVNHLMDIISSIFAPFLYPLAACGVLQGLISFFAAIGWMDSASGTFRILNFVSWTGFTFLPVDLYRSQVKEFTMEGNALRCPFTSLKGFGEQAAISIVEERKQPFLSTEDLKKRTRITNTGIEMLLVRRQAAQDHTALVYPGDAAAHRF